MSQAGVMQAPVANAPVLDASLRDYLDTNADIVTRIKKPVSIDFVGALSAQSDTPILFENIIEKPGYRLCDILVKNRTTQARALGVSPSNYLKTLAFRLRQPPRLIRATAPTGKPAKSDSSQPLEVPVKSTGTTCAVRLPPPE